MFGSTGSVITSGKLAVAVAVGFFGTGALVLIAGAFVATGGLFGGTSSLTASFTTGGTFAVIVGLMERMFFCSWFMCPFRLDLLSGKCLVINLVVRPGKHCFIRG